MGLAWVSTRNREVRVTVFMVAFDISIMCAIRTSGLARLHQHFDFWPSCSVDHTEDTGKTIFCGWSGYEYFILSLCGQMNHFLCKILNVDNNVNSNQTATEQKTDDGALKFAMNTWRSLLNICISLTYTKRWQITTLEACVSVLTWRINLHRWEWKSTTCTWFITLMKSFAD